METKKEIELVSWLKTEVNNSGGTLLNAYLGGSHLYGGTSANSDIDIKGCYALHKENFLGLKTQRDVLELKGDYDTVLFELKKLAGLAISGNCNVLEELNAKQLYHTGDFLTLQQLINNAFGKTGLYNSYKGLATYNYKTFILQGKNFVKKYLYVLRGLMAGIYVLQTGRTQANIQELNNYFKIPEVNQLLELKRNGFGLDQPKDIDQARVDKIILDLFTKLDEAYIKCKMPETPAQEEIDEIDKFIIGLRLRLI